MKTLLWAQRTPEGRVTVLAARATGRPAGGPPGDPHTVGAVSQLWGDRPSPAEGRRQDEAEAGRPLEQTEGPLAQGSLTLGLDLSRAPASGPGSREN